MRRKLISTLLCVSMAVTMLTGCGGKESSSASGTEGTNTSSKEDASSENADGEEADSETEVVTTTGDANGTHFDMWTFVEMHSQFYSNMVQKWNEENPDKTIEVTFTTYPFADMHNKLTLALQSGEGAPDLCDVEVGQFPNFLQGEVQFKELNSFMEPYTKDIV